MLFMMFQHFDQHVFFGNDGSYGLTESGTNTYQWQVSNDGGIIFNDITDGIDYTGTQTNFLTIFTPDFDKNGFIYRAILSNNTFICDTTLSDEVVLTVGPRTVITNRRITIRVKKD